MGMRKTFKHLIGFEYFLLTAESAYAMLYQRADQDVPPAPFEN
jgi:hypothetical protein